MKKRELVSTLDTRVLEGEGMSALEDTIAHAKEELDALQAEREELEAAEKRVRGVLKYLETAHTTDGVRCLAYIRAAKCLVDGHDTRTDLAMEEVLTTLFRTESARVADMEASRLALLR